MDYKKPQSTLVHGGVGLYPLTTADQVILADGSRLEKDGKISADSASDSSKLGGKAPEYYVQPRNLLDNSDFRNPVNQRGKTSYTDNDYTIDRWSIWSANADSSLTLVEGGIAFNPGTGNGTFTQRLPLDSLDSAKTYTLAVHKSNGETEVRPGSIAFYFNNSCHLVTISTIQETIVWAVLYEGSYTADTLPPYVPKGYAVELAECQRYFWLCDNSYFSEGCGYAFAPTECRFMISTPQTMRISPSIIADNNNTTSYGIKLIINGTILTPTSVSVRRTNNRLCLTLNGKFTTNAVGVMRIESQLSFSADL